MEITDKTHAGIYIFEGIDNVGKTTITQKLKEKIIETTQYDCITIAFPGNEPKTLGSLVYNIHHHQDRFFDVPINETSLQLLHIASHIDLIQRKLKESSNSKCIVLLDRFWWSTYVYGLAGGLGKDIIQAIIAPELIYWEDINIRKIFLIEREERERDYGLKKENVIIKKYRELAENDSKCTTICNVGCLKDMVTKIYNIILGE